MAALVELVLDFLDPEGTPIGASDWTAHYSVAYDRDVALVSGGEVPRGVGKPTAATRTVPAPIVKVLAADDAAVAPSSQNFTVIVSARFYRNDGHAHGYGTNDVTRSKRVSVNSAHAPKAFLSKLPGIPAGQDQWAMGDAVIYYNAGTSSYPVRESVEPGDGQRVRWVGPVAPPTTSGYFLDEFDIWETI